MPFASEGERKWRNDTDDEKEKEYFEVDLVCKLHVTL
jgi:hypothetical protein